MIRRSCAAILSVILCFGAAAAQEQTKVLNKTADEWIALLKNGKEVPHRRAALVALEVFGPKVNGVVAAVSEALEKDADALVRREAATLLGNMGQNAKDAAPALADALLRDKEPKVREAAARAFHGELIKFADGQLRALAEALNDSDQPTRSAAAEVLLKLGEKAAPVYASIHALAKDTSKDRFSRQYALKVLSRVGSDRLDAAEVLVAVLQNTKEPLALREEAADGLGRLTVVVDKVVPPLAEGLTDSEVAVRRAAAAALVRQGKDAKVAWPKIRGAFKDMDNAVRYQLLRLAGQLAKDSEEPILVLLEHARKDTNIENRLAAIQELGQLTEHADRIIRELETMANTDTEAAIRNAAEVSLKKLKEAP
jgi:HEAT repeat protein